MFLRTGAASTALHTLKVLLILSAEDTLLMSKNPANRKIMYLYSHKNIFFRFRTGSQDYPKRSNTRKKRAS